MPEHLRAVQASVIAAGVVGWKRVGQGMPFEAPPPAPELAPRAGRARGWLLALARWLGFRH